MRPAARRLSTASWARPWILPWSAVALGYIFYQAKKRHINPYKEDVFVDQKYYKDSMARADLS